MAILQAGVAAGNRDAGSQMRGKDRTMRTKIVWGVLGLVFSLALTTEGQNAGSSSHTYIPRAVLEALAKTDGDHPARAIDIAKSYNLGAYLLHLSARKPEAITANGWAHHDISELYYVIRGSGAFLI